MSRFNGNYVHLSTNKFGSNVVEKCLKMWEDARDSIILELLSASHFDILLQDQYGNYVIQSALVNSKVLFQITYHLFFLLLHAIISSGFRVASITH